MTTNPDETCCWYPERQELLHVNLLPIIGIHTTLVLTSWNHSSGITWSLITDGGIEQYDDPFLAPFFQISDFLSVCVAKPYLDQIPSQLLAMLKSYRADSFGMLMLINQNKNLTILCGNYRMPFWLSYRLAKKEQWNQQQFISLCESGIWNVLKALNLPANQAALDVLSKITASHCYTQFHVDLIQQTFKQLDYRHLNSKLETAPDHLLQFLLRHPDLQHVKFLGQLERDDYHDLLRTIRAIQHLAVELKIDSVNVKKQALECDSFSALKTLQAHLREETTHKALRDYEKQLESAETSSRSFPQLSLFAGRDDLEQILNEAALLTESKLIQQNLMQYVPGILSGHYAIYQQLKPQRATALYYLFPEQGGGIRPLLKCQYSADDFIKRQ